jgi:transcriptional regulator with XRE-family HTH domain
MKLVPMGRETDPTTGDSGDDLDRTQRPTSSPAEIFAQVGEEIQNLRKAKRLSLEKLSQRSGVSIGLISQIERGIGNPQFNTLVQLAHALDTSFSRLLLGADEKRSPVVRRHERRQLSPGHPDGEVRELLTPGLDHLIEVVWVEMPPGYNTKDNPFTHAGEEVGVILEGKHTVWLDGIAHQLEPGDSITYPSTVPHWYEVTGDETVKALWVISPPSF